MEEASVFGELKGFVVFFFSGILNQFHYFLIAVT